MRKVEIFMLKTLWEKRNAVNGNTSIVHFPTQNISKVKLYNNLIATVNFTKKYPKVTINLPVVIKFPTKTTFSRLRALGIKIRKTEGGIYLDSPTARLKELL